MVAGEDDRDDAVEADGEAEGPPVDGADSWDDLMDAPIEAVADDQFFGQPIGEDIVVGEAREAFQMPRCLPAPKAPSLALQVKHKLFHYPYASWCP